MDGDFNHLSRRANLGKATGSSVESPALHHCYASLSLVDHLDQVSDQGSDTPDSWTVHRSSNVSGGNSGEEGDEKEGGGREGIIDGVVAATAANLKSRFKSLSNFIEYESSKQINPSFSSTQIVPPSSASQSEFSLPSNETYRLKDHVTPLSTTSGEIEDEKKDNDDDDDNDLTTFLLNDDSSSSWSGPSPSPSLYQHHYQKLTPALLKPPDHALKNSLLKGYLSICHCACCKVTRYKRRTVDERGASAQRLTDALAIQKKREKENVHLYKNLKSTNVKCIYPSFPAYKGVREGERENEGQGKGRDKGESEEEEEEEELEKELTLVELLPPRHKCFYCSCRLCLTQRAGIKAKKEQVRMKRVDKFRTKCNCRPCCIYRVGKDVGVKVTVPCEFMNFEEVTLAADRQVDEILFGIQE